MGDLKNLPAKNDADEKEEEIKTENKKSAKKKKK